MDTDLLCVILRPRCGVWGCRSAGVGPPFPTKLPRASVCVCTDAVAPDPRAGSGCSVPGGGASAGSLQRPGAGTQVRPLPAPRAPRPGERRRPPGPKETCGGARPPRIGEGSRAPSGAGRGAWPVSPASAGLGRRRRRSGGTSRPRPVGQRPAWPRGFVPALVLARGGLWRRVPGGRRAGGHRPGRGLAPGASRPRSARGGLARWACPASATERARWGRGAPGDRAVPGWPARGPASPGDLGPGRVGT